MRRRTRTLAAVTTVLLATACGTDTAAPQDPVPSAPDTSTATTPATSDAAPTPDGTTAPTLDPSFAVDPPGERTGPVTVGDILVSSKATLDPDVVERIADLDGVVAVTAISLSNVPVENKVYNLAAVDPAQYRLFTVADSADFQDQWDRVAGGEVAVSSALEKKLPLQPDDFVQLGSGGEDAVHVGAYAPQVEQIDMVVNAKRGEALGMVPDNALVINTGETSPGTLREPIEDIVGADVSVQNLDAVARYGLDPDAFLSVQFLGSFADAVGVFNYTPSTGGRITPDPAWVASHITTEVVPILGSVTCNKYMMPQLKAALAEIVTQGLAAEIHPDEYAGCYYPRFIAGSTKLSNHSFGLALDLNVPGNGRGTVGDIDRGVVAIFKRWGFAWGGDWSYTDPMHFELERIVRPG